MSIADMPITNVPAINMLAEGKWEILVDKN